MIVNSKKLGYSVSEKVHFQTYDGHCSTSLFDTQQAIYSILLTTLSRYTLVPDILVKHAYAYNMQLYKLDRLLSLKLETAVTQGRTMRKLEQWKK